MPRHFLDAAPNSRDRPLAMNIVPFEPEVNAWEEVVERAEGAEVVEVIQGVEGTYPIRDPEILVSR